MFHLPFVIDRTGEHTFPWRDSVSPVRDLGTKKPLPIVLSIKVSAVCVFSVMGKCFRCVVVINAVNLGQIYQFAITAEPVSTGYFFWFPWRLFLESK